MNMGLESFTIVSGMPARFRVECHVTGVIQRSLGPGVYPKRNDTEGTLVNRKQLWLHFTIDILHKFTSYITIHIQSRVTLKSIQILYLCPFDVVWHIKQIEKKKSNPAHLALRADSSKHSK